MPNIWSGSRELNGLCAALTNPTELAFRKGVLKSHYPVTYEEVEYVDAETAYKTLKKDIELPGMSWPEALPKLYRLMRSIIMRKFEQHPRLLHRVRELGGRDWILSCSHHVNGGRWEGDGEDSPFIRALADGYEIAELDWRLKYEG